MRNQEAPYSGIAGLMAAQGRYGDTELLHVRPDELAGLASMGQLTVNPDTGLPEAFNFRSLLPAIGAVAGSILLPGIGTAAMAPTLAAVGSGFGSFAGGLAAGQSPTQALMGGLMSGATAGLMGGLMGPSDAALSAGVESAGSTAVAAPSTQAAMPAQVANPLGQVTSDPLGSSMDVFGPYATDILPGPQSTVGVPDTFSMTNTATGNTTSFTGPQPAPLAGPPSARPTGSTPSGVQMNPETLAKAQESFLVREMPSTIDPQTGLATISKPDFISTFGADGIQVLGEKGYDLSFADKVGGLASRPSNLFPIAKAGIGAFLEQDNEQFKEKREDLEDVGSTYTPEYKTLEGGEFKDSGKTEADYVKTALEGGRESALTPFIYKNLAEGGQPTAEETDTVVEEETVDSENQRKEEEVLQKKKAASEADKFISDTVGGAALTAMVGAELGQGLVQDPAAIATPYGQTGQDFNVGTDFGFNQGGLVGLAVGGNPRNGSKKNSFTPKQEVVYSFFKEKGYPSESIAAIMGNIAVEAPTFDFTQRESGKKKGINQGLGLFQYTGGRQKDYARYLRENDLKDSAPNQMEYFHEQISSTVPDGELPYDAGGLNRKRLQKILLGKGMGAVEERADVIREIFLRPKKGKEHKTRRMEESLNMFNLIPDAELYNKGGGIGQYFEGKVVGPGDGQSDQVLFEVEGDDPDMALLSPDEYVIPADTVAMIGSGSSTAGAKKLDGFVKNIRQKATGSKKQQKPIKQGLESFLK